MIIVAQTLCSFASYLLIITLEFFLNIFTPIDGGPIYQEFNALGWIKEPWNAITSLLFFIPVFYFGLKTRWQARKYWMWFTIVPFLILNGVGSTAYHAFRDSYVFRYMDFVGAATAAFLVMLFFWQYVLNSWWKALPAILLINCLRIPFFYIDLPKQWTININYIITGVMAGVPIVVYLIRKKGHQISALLGTVGFMILALVFRLIDREPWQPFPMGTHFLWHLCTTLALFPLSRFLIIHQEDLLKRN